MSQFNQFNVNNLSADQFILRGQRWNLDGANIGGVNTTALTTEVIINDDTKNQVLFEEIYGNIHGNTFPQLQAEIDALEANVALLQAEDINLQNQINATNSNVLILQGNVVSLQSQINVLTGNVVIDEQAIAELISDTQFLEAPYAGLVGNTSYFINGLQMWSGADENGNGMFVYKDGGNVGLNQIRMRVEDDKNILVEGGSQLLKPKSTGNVSIKNTDGNFQFLVGNSNLANFYLNSITEINGRTKLQGQDSNRIEVYTQPATLVPPSPAVKRVDIRGDNELRMFGAFVKINEDGGGFLQGASGQMLLQGGSGGYFTVDKNPRIQTVGGSSPGTINIQVGECDLNTTGRINIGTEQGLTELGYKEIYIGQAGPPGAARKSSTLIDGDIYLPQNYLPPPAGGGPNLGGWDNILYLGIPTPYSGAFRGPLKNTFSPYVRSISTFSATPTINSFISSSGTFSVAVGLGAITLNAGAGGVLVNCAGGLCSLTSLIGGIGLTTAGGAIALTTGAGIIQMTTGAAPIAMETNIGDILLKAGYSNQSTPELSLGSVYIQARDFSYITPDKGVIVGEGIVTPFNETLINTMNYAFSGNLFSNAFIPNLTGVFSNSFQTPNSTATLLNPITSNLIYSNTAFETGTAIALLRNIDINGTIATSSTATVPSGNLGANVAITNTTTNFYFPDNTVLPLNANVKVFVYIPDTPNIANYSYSTWQANANIASNISALVNAYVEPLPPSYENYMTVLGNVGILSELDVGANITVASSSFPLQQTLITRNSVLTTGDMTCSTLNYTTLNPPIMPGGAVDSIIAGTNVSISPLNGQGNVVINCILPNVAGVNQIIAGNGIQVSPVGGQGNVTVSLAGSVIPPGGYLPIAGGTMTGSIYQSPATATSGTIKKYRPLTSYQPPFPSISTPSFTGEQLTFFNGDNSPEQTYFTGWFPQFMFGYQPTVITQAIPGVASNFYSSTGGTLSQFTDFPSIIGNFTVGQRITGGNMIVNGSNPGYRGVLFYIYTAPPNTGDRTQWTLLYQTTLKNFPTTASTYSLSDIDYTYDGSIPQLGQNWMVVYTDYNTTQEYIGLNTVNGQVGGLVNYYQWDGNIANYVAPDEYFVGVQGDALTSVLYEYFPATNTVNKLLAVSAGGVPAIINGIYYDDVAVSREIIVYGNFTTLTNTSGTITVNHIFQYNIDTGAINVLTTATTDPAYASQKPIGFNNQVWGVEKQLSTVFSRRVWCWGEFSGVNTMGNPAFPIDVASNGSGIAYTLSDNWSIQQTWGAIVQNTILNACRGGRIVQDNPNNYADFALMVWATTRGSINFRTLSIVYYSGGSTQSSTAYPFSNGNFGNPAITTNVITRIDKVFITNPGILAVVFCGSYIGVAHGGGMVDVPCYSLSSTDITNNGFNPAFTPPWQNDLKILADSGDASFWYPNNKLIGSTTYQKMTNEIAVIGTTGYATTTTNGGGVMTFNNADFYVSAPTVNKYLIDNVQAYSVLNVIGTNALAVNLSCSLNEDNFWFGQTFNANISPSPPTPPTIPTVNAINGAKFLVNNTEMDKIVFSGGDTDFASVSFIAGSVENGDPHWYWQSQVGALDYYAGNVLYPNITASGSVGGSGVYTAGQNITISGNVISLSDPLTANLDLASVAITGNGFNNEINMTLDFTGLSVLNTVSNDNSKLDELDLVFTDFTNDRVSQYQANTGIAFEDLGGNMVSNLRREQLTFSDTVLNNLTNVNSTQVQVQNTGTSQVILLDNSIDPQLKLQNTNNNFTITKSGFDTNINQTVDGNINFSTNNIFSITSQNAVEIGTPQRRQLIIPFEKQNTGALTGQNNFDSVSGIQNVSAWSNPTNDIYINSITVAYGYDDGNNGNSTITIALIQDDSGTETVLGSQNISTSSGLSTNPVIFSPAITINPSATKTFFVRMSVPPQNPMYSYYGTVDGLTPYCVVLASQLESVSDPIEYFNVYGNSFFQDNMLIHANLVVADPTSFFYTQLEHNYILLQGETFNTQVAPGQTYITNGVNQQIQQATYLQVKRTDITRQATLTNGSLAFIEDTSRTATYSPFTCDINSTSGPIARATLQVGSLALNNNSAGGSTITLNKDAISVATDEISSISSSTKDANGTSRVFSRIATRASAVGTGNQDGTLAIFTLINGVLTETFNFNGNDNEINSFRPIDVNGQSLKTSSGNLLLSAASSTGTGNFTIEPKSATGDLIFNGTNIQSATSGGSAGTHLRIKLNGVYYKIALQQDT